MKCRSKNTIKHGKIIIPKNQTGKIVSVMSGELKGRYGDVVKGEGVYYLVDFPEEKEMVVSARDIDLD